MSKAETLLNRLLVASKGVSTSERQAQARVKTNDYFEFNKKEAKAEGLLAAVAEIEAEIQALRAATADTALVEVYDAALSVFTKWAGGKAAA